MILSFNSLLCVLEVKAGHICRLPMYSSNRAYPDTYIGRMSYISQWVRTYNLTQTRNKALRATITKADKAQTELMADLTL